jgi:hypothetical protein
MTMAEVNHRTIRMWIKDLMLYCIIGVLVAATAILAGIHQARVGVKSEGTVKWIGFSILTALVFGNAIRYSKSYWSSVRFWGLLIVFSLPHFIVGFLVLSKVTKLGLIRFAMVTPVEYFFLDSFLRRFLK